MVVLREGSIVGVGGRKMEPERQTGPVATVSTEGRRLGCRGRGGEEEEIKKGTLERL
jgi:hypothetical protein